MLKGLKINSAVKSGDYYLVLLGSGKYSKYNLDGSQTKFDVAAYNGTTMTMEVIENLTKLEVITPTRLSHYTTPEGEHKTVDQYNNILSTYKTNYEVEDGDVEYPDLETEFMCRKELTKISEWKRHYTDEEVKWVPVQIDIVGEYQDTGSKFIETPISIGSVEHRRGQGFYKVLSSLVAHDQYKKLETQYKDSTHTFHNEIIRKYLDFAKVNEEMIFYNKYPWCKEGVVSFFPTLIEAQEHESEIRSAVTATIKDGVTPCVLDMITARSVLGDIRRALDSVRSIEPKQKSRQDKIICMKKLTGLIESLDQYISSEHNEKEQYE